MTSIEKLVCLAAIGIGCAIPVAALAGKCAGTNINNLVSWDQTEIAKGTTHATLRVTSVTVNDDPSAPSHLVSGECIGVCVMTPDGKTKCSGTCARADREGDVLNEDWVSTNDTGDKGTWRNAGGTGKFAKAANTAEWEIHKLPGKATAVRWTGTCQ